ncbi:SusD/RagB family nutrient-binding outer membrane lipoprotein [Algibacter miyuki]|uniref:SusD/RagB family nutrient-binding outer membrane lipoprotein n=1 Tax=Algibacter miyuki TaxID=1306933 RepID=A0ABV5GX95_9FLAO|nr:SusD/RagB family nutrient-binding outer membrane lipoprotein [Algibacter miyuki]MDN3664985.1 SusD/RagB family nutrient-binding outer membrane lipoprotein [Algibacter miyuki]
MTKKIFLFTSIVLSILCVSCELKDFDFQDDPSQLTPEDVSPDFLLNEVQYQFQLIMREHVRNTDDIMRYEAMTDSYSDVVSDDVLNLEWSSLYSMRINDKILQELAASNEDLKFHSAMSKLLTGYATATMVDYVGDIPFSEALQGLSSPNPKTDDSVVIYDSVLMDIDDAIADLNVATVKPFTDLYFKGDTQKWINFARSLKLKMLLQTRLVNANFSSVPNIVNEINNLIASGVTTTGAGDFQFSYSTEISPDGRHFYFERGYSTNGMFEYISNYFMYMLKDSKDEPDPRLRYYVYRQSDTDPVATGFIICTGNPDYDYCYVGDLYSGIDHGDERTGRADRFLRTIYGLYPGGGAFDADNFVTAVESPNLGGAGILPLLSASYVKFLMAESALTLGTTGDPAVLLEEGIRLSMDKVLNFSPVDPAFAATTTDVDNYVAEVMASYANAASDAEKLDIIITESYLAGFGNSIAAYNAYRRTGYPSNIQEPVDNVSIPFPRTFLYPKEAINANTSLNQKTTTVKVFWDNNPDGFIK